MRSERIGFLHPGAMGVSLAASATASGHEAHWVSAGRSAATRARAEEHGLVETGSLDELCGRCETIVSICPPDAAAQVAESVAACGWRGLYADCNAISPQRSRAIGERLAAAGIDYVDGGVVGGPAWTPGETWLHLSGPSADRLAACFDGGPLEVRTQGDEIGRASAVKMCFAAWTKGGTALLCAIVAAAESMGVREALETQWAEGGSAFAETTRRRLRGVTAKAWRFAGEMEEIATTLGAAGQPEGFHRAACEIYGRLAHFKDAPERPALEEVLAALRASEGRGGILAGGDDGGPAPRR